MSKVLPNPRRYLVSLAEELSAQANRVRDLIGDAHWLTDGHHKEYLLIDLLKRHLPTGILASRGFVISPADTHGISTEQDILIVDTMQEAPVFYQSGIIIAFPRAVKAAISVKTTLENGTIKASVSGLRTVRDVASGHTDPRSIWCGAYYFTNHEIVDRNASLVFGYIQGAIEAFPVKAPLLPLSHPHPSGPDIHCSSRDLVFKLNHGYYDADQGLRNSSILGYRCKGMATAIFLGELLDHIATQRGLADADFSLFSEVADVEALTPPSRQS